jgi:hypothetical protein
MFVDYQQIYCNLINFRKNNPAPGYTERHHILMRSMGGSNDPSNLVVLTGREHWVAHLLLDKIHNNQQTAFACHMMAMRCEERGIPYIKNSRMYETIRNKCAKFVSKISSKHQVGSGNSQYGTRWICNIALQKNKKINKDDCILEGWIFGKNKWVVPKQRPSRRKPRLKSGKTLKQEQSYINVSYRYSINNEIFIGLKDICAKYNLTHPAVINRIKSKNFPLWIKLPA